MFSIRPGNGIGSKGDGKQACASASVLFPVAVDKGEMTQLQKKDRWFDHRITRLSIWLILLIWFDLIWLDWFDWFDLIDNRVS